MAAPAIRIPIGAKMEEFDRAMGDARDKSSAMLRQVAQQVGKFNQEIAGGAAAVAGNWAASWVSAGARVAGGIALGIGAAILTTKAIGAVIDSVRDQLADVLDLANKAAGAQVSPEFWQSFIAGARNAKVSVEDLEDALKHANEQTKGRLAPDWSVWDDGKRKITDVEKALTDLRELFTTDQKFTGLDLFRNAGDTENRARAVLTAMTELEAIGQNLASLDLAEKMFGGKFADNVRQGNTSAKELLATIDKLAEDKTGVWSNKLIEDSKEIDRQLKQANDFLSREMKPGWEGLVGVANDIKSTWASIVDLLASGIAIINRLNQFDPIALADRLRGGTPVSPVDLGGQLGLGDIGKGAAPNALGVAAGTVDIGQPRDRFGNTPLPQRRPSDAPKAHAGKETEESAIAFETATDAINRNIAALQADAAAVGLSEAAHQQLRVELRLIEAARQSGVEITDQQIEAYTRLRGSMGAEQALSAAGIELTKEQAAQFGKLSDRILMVAGSLDSKRRAFQGVNDAIRFAGNELVDVIDKATQKGAKFGEIMSDVLRSVSRQLLMAALTGEGAFAKILGVSSTTGGVGGIGGVIASLFKSGSGATAGATSMTGIAGDLAVPTFGDGGVIPPGGLALVSEHSASGGRLMRAPANEPIMVTPNDVRAGAGVGAMQIVNHIDASGADPASIGRLERAVAALNRNQASQARALVSGRRFAETGVS